MQTRIPIPVFPSRWDSLRGRLAAALAGASLLMISGAAAAIDCPKGTREQGIGGAFPLEVVCLVEKGPQKGLRHGPYARFFKNGAKRETGQYKNGARVGKWKYWHSTGAFAGEANFFRARKHGPFKNLSPDGRLVAEGSFFQGKRHGVWRTNEEGEIRSSLYQLGTLVAVPSASLSCPMGNKIAESQIPERKGSSVMLDVKACVDESGTRDGTTWTFGPLGEVRIEQEYDAGIPHGRYTAWLEDGMLKMDGRFKEGKKVGLWRVFNREGRPQIEIPLKDGQKHGTSVRFHDNGLKAEETEYKNGLPDGIYSQWNDDGKLLGNNIFVAGSGTYTRWYDNGEILEEGELVDGRRDGEWKKFKPDGWLQERSVYANGRRVSRGR